MFLFSTEGIMREIPPPPLLNLIMFLILLPFSVGDLLSLRENKVVLSWKLNVFGRHSKI